MLIRASVEMAPAPDIPPRLKKLRCSQAAHAARFG